MFDSNETWDFMKCVEFLDQLNSCQLLKRDSVPCRASSKLLSWFPSCVFDTFLRNKPFQVNSSCREEIRVRKSVFQCSSCIFRSALCAILHLSLAVMFCLLQRVKVLLQKQPHYAYLRHIIVFYLYFINIGQYERHYRLVVRIFDVYILAVCCFFLPFP